MYRSDWVLNKIESHTLWSHYLTGFYQMHGVTTLLKNIIATLFFKKKKVIIAITFKNLGSNIFEV